MNGSDTRGGRQSGHFAVAVALLLASSSGGCTLFSPTDQEVYVLVRVNGEPVPATAIRLESPENEFWRELRILQGRFILSADGRWRETQDSETVINGVASRSSWQMSGRYETSGSEIVLYDDSPSSRPGGDNRRAEIRMIGEKRVLSFTDLVLLEWELRR